MTNANVLLIAGVIAAILGAVEVYQSKGTSLAAIGVVVIGVALAIVGLR